ncbi:MAG: hypothetical protein AB8B81_03315 [Halioglobus sp.]
MSSKGIGINVKAITAYRVPYYHKELPFLVSWSQKAGCTSVFKWFLHHCGLYDEAVAYLSDAQGLNIHAYELDILRKKSGYKEGIASHLARGRPVINFLRCPYQRAFSSFMHLNNRNFIRQVHNGVSSPGLRVREDLLAFVYGAGSSIEYPVSFLDYLRWLDSDQSEIIDPHHKPQYSEIFNYRAIQHYKLEDFNQRVGEIERQFELPVSEGKSARFSSGHHLKKESVPHKRALTLLEKSLPMNLSENFRIPHVTRELLVGTPYDALIRKIFFRDIALYESL